MGPSLKRRRTKAPTQEPLVGLNTPPGRAEENASQEPPAPAADSPAAHTSEDVAPIQKNVGPEISSTEQLKPKSSWYGTWPRKPRASTQLARETILANKQSNVSSTETLDRVEPRKPVTTSVPRPPSMYLGKGKETLDITMGGTFEEENTAKIGTSSGQPATKPVDETLDTGKTGINQSAKPSLVDISKQDGKYPETDANTTNEAGKQYLVDVPMQDAGSAEIYTKDTSKPGKESTTENTKLDSEPVAQQPVASSGWFGGWLGRSEPQPVTRPQQMPIETDPKVTAIEEPTLQVESASAEVGDQNSVVAEIITQKPASSSWFGLWSTAPPSTSTESPKEILPVKSVETSQDTVMEDAPPTDAPPAGFLPKTTQPAPGSSWAFWSTESTKKTSPEKREETGQLAVVGEPSQAKPEPAKAATTKETKSPKPNKRSRPESSEARVENAPPEPVSKTAAQNTAAPLKASPPNLLLPSVTSTYRLCENPSILQQIARLLLLGKQQPVKHVFLTKDPPRIKKALAIGIHGLFPAPLLRTVIGQPTGTSIRFANHAAASIRRWTDKNGSSDCEIEKVALEGEGKIAERVDNLWKLLLNWIDHIRQADFILIACHSQGVPVALMLVAKLIEFGVVSTSRIGVCAMAGVSLGPFPDYKSRLFSGSAGELFEFADPESVVSKRYEDSLKVALKYGVRVTYCGSIDDQLVSMESSTFSIASHPYIYRAVFIDGRIHAPDFLSHLVGFALKLRNLGVPDHGLIRELSAPLAGSLYTGEGHSRLYDDGNVYDLAIEFALQTTSVGDVPLDLKKYEIPSNANPYVLPWIMRGLLEEEFVKTELSQETANLLKQFDDWKPSTKVLKDVKYRLEAVRSKL